MTLYFFPIFRMNKNRTSPAHTPGPWKAVRRECDFGCGDGVPSYYRIVARNRRDDLARTFGCHEQEANARLIAAAPLLLERITEMRNLTESLDYDDGDDEGRMNAMEAALDEIRAIGYATIAEVRGTAA